MKKIFIPIFFILSIGTQIEAQHLTQYTNYMFNKLAYNPAYAGSRDALTANALYRNQWSGIDGAPTNINFNIHTPIMKNRAGLGLSVVSDQIGMFNTNYVNLSYSYSIPVNDNTSLGLGIMGRLEHGRTDWTKADALHTTDALLSSTAVNEIQPNFGAGLYLRNEKFYMGLSVPQMMRNTLYDNRSDATNVRSYYLMAGLMLNISENIKFKPSALVSYNPSAPVDLDVSAMFLLMDVFWIGGTYRLDDSFDGIIQYQLTQQLRAGIAGDFTVSELQKCTVGSFELMVEYTFHFNNESIKNIRYF